ncbi:MAG: hypothetical protein COX19_07540 [Desulfobacterales bacterium CG23_combo_of_CG06-09_8_20_14_all_51_8]|nr:MAG: hypothetical protein COX19_07540 [Desulfobacterales bacterium CG23_combo_of_CG06-09_8_20_14_all_51_8]
MWKCEMCGRKNEDNVDPCKFCGAKKGAILSAETNKYPTEYITSYGTARMLCQFVSFIGCAAVGISVLIFIFSIIGSIKSNSSLVLIGILPSLAGIMGGLILVMVGQITRTTVDTADNTGQMLTIMKKK